MIIQSNFSNCNYSQIKSCLFFNIVSNFQLNHLALPKFIVPTIINTISKIIIILNIVFLSSNLLFLYNMSNLFSTAKYNLSTSSFCSHSAEFLFPCKLSVIFFRINFLNKIHENLSILSNKSLSSISLFNLLSITNL